MSSEIHKNIKSFSEKQKVLFDADVINFLKEKNYRGWLVIEAEQDPAKANPFEYAKIGYKYLSKAAKNCGFDIIN